ncbi:hypothetical protein BDQ12DRAFT_617238 [Crucibulum laeve]|uniref:DUF6593 domain-containing protein n=1 Tax=Crucibulum laeve TaxID=68775 RepID=A0A5C3LI74_9AGAR|nr:hypothetical protein BDQ12DRAFT_617238 [Crucibulum laeve]
MYSNNPFGTWAEAGQGHSSNTVWGGGAPPPSVFGALPYPAASSNLVTFYFTSFSPDILNCSIVGPQGQTLYRVVTDNQMPGYTVIKNAEGRNISLIEWQAHPFIEIRGILPKQNVRNWLRLSPDRASRTMDVRGMRYMWSPSDKAISLFAGSASHPTFLSKITRTHGNITLDMASDALQLGILDTVIAAALLLQCGRNID